ncbi:heme-binding protein [uncultured Microbacterium sp.]|uniref:SOUL family heme-binding protein n=1 Tax=uncultured Microbacterium sp. TaxID=191216 RepID=UPI0028D67132|nr:heme-binding protein [uncultured Microbacterium sp.]
MTEQQLYEVVRAEPDFELRRYPEHVVAETLIRDAEFEDAGSRAFRYLFGYISGDNTARQSIEMTAPVVQSPARGSRIAMTAPAVQEQSPDGFVVAFVLPAGMTEATAPAPSRPEVTLRTVHEKLSAVLRFSGRWTESSWQKHRKDLLAAVNEAGLTVLGEPRFARFDPPYTPWFLRRNEVLVDVAESS